MLFVGHSAWGSLGSLSSAATPPFFQPAAAYQSAGRQAVWLQGSTTGQRHAVSLSEAPSLSIPSTKPETEASPASGSRHSLHTFKKGTPRPSIQHQIEAFGDRTKFDTCSSRALTSSGSIPADPVSLSRHLDPDPLPSAPSFDSSPSASHLLGFCCY
jgi:hypothetical protein